MALEDNIIAIFVEEYGVENNQYPRMSIFFDDVLIEENIEVREIKKTVNTLLPEWTGIKAGNDVPKNESGADSSCYKFIVELDNHNDRDTTSTHKIRVVFTDTELSCCINIRSISANSIIIIGCTDLVGSVHTENPELEISFTMPLYPYRKVLKLEKFNKEEVNYPEIFKIPFSTRFIKKHVCTDRIIEMMGDYYEKQEMTKLLSDKKLLSIPELYPLWLTFQTAFDEHCVKFN